jgi:hypothetical protein
MSKTLRLQQGPRGLMRASIGSEIERLHRGVNFLQRDRRWRLEGMSPSVEEGALLQFCSVVLQSIIDVRYKKKIFIF